MSLARLAAMAIDRLSISELAMLVPDDVGWPQDLAAVAIVAGARLRDPRGELDLARVRASIGQRLHRVPRFRQEIVRPRLGLGLPYWADAAGFDLADHVRIWPLPDRAGEAELLAAFEQLRACRFAPGRPAWELWLLPGLAGGDVGLIVKLHHTIADGVSGVATLGALLDVDPGVEPPPAPAWSPRPRPRARALLVDNLRRRLRELVAPLIALVHPVRTARALARALPLLREGFREARAPRTTIERRVGDRRRVTLLRARLATCKAIAHAHGAKLNDVLLAALAGGLRALLQRRGEPVDGLVLRVAVPVAQHADRAAARGNHDSGMIVPVDVGEPDPARRLAAIAAETRVRKQKPRPVYGGIGYFPGVMTMLRGFSRYLGRQRMVNVYLANVPGPPLPLYLAGAPVREVFPIVPLTGNTPLAAGALSYAGELGISVVCDPDAVPDADVLAAGTAAALDALAATVAGSGTFTPERPSPPPSRTLDA